MKWEEILGHDGVQQMFAAAIRRNRLGGSFLFVGPPSIGKRMFAFMLAKTLLCQRADPAEMAPCGVCEDCQQVDALTHPDLLTLAKPKDKSRIPLELLIGDDKHRMRSGLCHDIALKPFRGRRKVAIIDDADDMNAEGANCLLKTLEEPPADSVIILISQSEQRQLPTIRSRCQVIRFAPLSDEFVARLLLILCLVSDAEAAQQLARQSKGSLARAEQLRDPQLQAVAQSLVAGLEKPDFPAISIAQEISEFLKNFGDDAPSKRIALSHLIEFAVNFYRQQLRLLASGQEMTSAGKQIASYLPSGMEGAVACMELCAMAEIHLDSNANLATLVECWLDDLSNASRLGIVPT